MYFAELEAASGRLARLAMAPMQMKRFRLHRPAAADVRWLAETMDHEARRFGGKASVRDDGWIEHGWPERRSI
jgi:poly-gamma-glutamate synthesis protein (capsule biosynthesis protein)